ncbi:MAG: glycosyltransferase [Aureisphaera sp.]
MRVLQLIDSLDAGGAERVAVNLANALSHQIDKSFLVTTRKEGMLKKELFSEVGYLFLRRKRTIDPSAVMRLRSFVKRNRITAIHAHSTSFFLATQVKMIYPKVRLVWHTHYGNRVITSQEQNKALLFCSRYFNSIVTVNEELKQWCLDTLKTKSVIYIPNFVPSERVLRLEMEAREKRIVCVANLKEPKNHLNLLRAFKKVHAQFPEWELCLVGRDFNDAYSKAVTLFCEDHQMGDVVQRMGQRDDVEHILSKALIGVLSSDNEGLPMSLLEYGAAGLAVVTTNVGQCAAVVNGNGKIVPPNDSDTLAKALIVYISDEELRKQKGDGFRRHISENYTTGAIIPRLMELY